MARDRELTYNHSAYIEQDVIARQTVNSFTHPTIAPTHSHAKNLEIYKGHAHREHTHTREREKVYTETNTYVYICITHNTNAHTNNAHSFIHMYTFQKNTENTNIIELYP